MAIIKVNVGTQLRDMGMRDALERITAQKPKRVKVGVLSKAGSERVRIAAIHEFGAGNIPERSFIRSTVNKNRRTYEGMMRQGAVAITDGDTDKAGFLTMMGSKVKSDIKTTMKRRIPPPLKPATVAARKRRAKADGRKFDDVPLIDRGDLFASINSQLSDK